MSTSYSDSYNSRYEATYTRYGDAQAHAGKVETKIERLGGTPTPNLVTNRRFEYDATGRLAKVFEPATAQVAIRSYEYDGNGRRRASGAADGSEVVTDSRDRVTAYNTGDRYGAAYPYYYRYGHDAAGRRTTWSRVYWPNLAGYNPALWTMVYSYDAAGQPHPSQRGRHRHRLQVRRPRSSHRQAQERQPRARLDLGRRSHRR
jgi:YD repeat-containing protein